VKRRLSKFIIGASIVGLGLPVVALAAASPAGATVRVSAINCTASTPLGNTAIQNPSTSDVTGPTWAAQGAAISIVTKGSVAVLPATAGGFSVYNFKNVTTTDELLGLNAPPLTGGEGPGDTAVTTVTNAPIPGYFYTPDLGATAPVPMDGVGSDPPAPLLTITQGPAILATGGIYFSTVVVGPGSGLTVTQPSVGGIGGAIISPDQPLAITNTGAINGPIKFIGTQTALTANVLAPPPGGIAAVTTCAPPASPEFVTHVHTTGGAIDTSEPAISCQPSAGTAGSFGVSKGFWSGPAGVGDPAAQAAGSVKAATTYDGCVVPDQQADAWNGSKHGAPAAVATTVAKASIALKGAGFGDCKLVSIRNAAGETEQGYPNTYQFAGSLSTKYLTSGNVATKLAGTSASVVIKFEIDENDLPFPPAPGSLTNSVEATGTVTKGFGIGGAVTFVGELDSTNAAVLAIDGCNGVGPVGAPNAFIGAIKGGLPFKTADNATFEVERP
jgi:hypothetical protein